MRLWGSTKEFARAALLPQVPAGCDSLRRGSRNEQRQHDDAGVGCDTAHGGVVATRGQRSQRNLRAADHLYERGHELRQEVPRHCGRSGWRIRALEAWLGASESARNRCFDLLALRLGQGRDLSKSIAEAAVRVRTKPAEREEEASKSARSHG